MDRWTGVTLYALSTLLRIGWGVEGGIKKRTEEVVAETKEK